jgi:hypothetical protein
MKDWCRWGDGRRVVDVLARGSEMIDRVEFPMQNSHVAIRRTAQLPKFATDFGKFRSIGKKSELDVLLHSILRSIAF